MSEMLETMTHGPSVPYSPLPVHPTTAPPGSSNNGIGYSMPFSQEDKSENLQQVLGGHVPHTQDAVLQRIIKVGGDADDEMDAHKQDMELSPRESPYFCAQQDAQLATEDSEDDRDTPSNLNLLPLSNPQPQAAVAMNHTHLAMPFTPPIPVFPASPPTGGYSISPETWSSQFQQQRPSDSTPPTASSLARSTHTSRRHARRGRDQRLARRVPTPYSDAHSRRDRGQRKHSTPPLPPLRTLAASSRLGAVPPGSPHLLSPVEVTESTMHHPASRMRTFPRPATAHFRARYQTAVLHAGCLTSGSEQPPTSSPLDAAPASMPDAATATFVHYSPSMLGSVWQAAAPTTAAYSDDDEKAHEEPFLPELIDLEVKNLVAAGSYPSSPIA
ncbi:hypothetical protein BST61_g11480 [Cercospora zeina]